ncbi:MAG: hypothetical protein MJ066_02645 [Clostridia bacterium]|nr:hypothetical protein [Clostridia bacterium]
MKNSKIDVYLKISYAVVLALSLIMAILDAVVPLNIWIHPIMTFLFFIFAGFGVVFYVSGFLKRSPYNFFLGAFFISLAIIYAFCCSFDRLWWLIFIVIPVLLALTAIISNLFNGNITEYADNDSDDYKNYQERKAEEEKKEEKEIKKELPELKSFKD